ncbi:hypothetical protein V3C99_003793 [Haemonchus contortus]
MGWLPDGRLPTLRLCTGVANDGSRRLHTRAAKLTAVVAPSPATPFRLPPDAYSTTVSPTPANPRDAHMSVQIEEATLEFESDVLRPLKLATLMKFDERRQ